MSQEIADSKLIDTWGSSGTKIKPDISKIIEGWQLGEQPPHEYMNWLQNTFGSKLNHILKNGVAGWNNETEYLAGASVQHSGNVWLCKTTNTNSEPTGLNANWEKLAISKDLTVTVDTLANLKSISYPANTVWVSGYHAKNDGAFGSHIFRLKGVKTTETDNSGTVIIATIGGTDYVYELQFAGAVNVKWFGAKGDNTFDNTLAIQTTIDYATTNKSSVFVPSGIYNINGILKITCSFIGQDKNTTKLNFKNNGVKELSLTIEESNIEVSNLSIDNGCSNDPADWTNNYDNFTGRYGARIYGNREGLKISNLNISNTIMAGIAVYGVAKNSSFENIYTRRNRGNFGDGFVFSSIDSCTVINCSAYDFTRIGFVTDVTGVGDSTPINSSFISCSAEYGHHESISLGGTEYNAGIWCEHSTNINIDNCTFKNITTHGVIVTSGVYYTDLIQSSVLYNISNCICDNTGNGYSIHSFGIKNTTANLENCIAINCTHEDISVNTQTDDRTVNANIVNFSSEKSFSGSQARVISCSANTNSGVVNLQAKNIVVVSDFNPFTFTYGGSNGHIGEYNNSGTVSINIDNFMDTNGVLLNKPYGANLGGVVISNCDNLLVYKCRCSSMALYNCGIPMIGSDTFGNSETLFKDCYININNDIQIKSNTIPTLVGNTDIRFENCNIFLNGTYNINISNFFASENEDYKVVAHFINCNIYKDYSGINPYAVMFSTKNDPNKTGIMIDKCFFYNTGVSGANAYPLYFINGYSSFLGTSYLDDTVQYFAKLYTELQVSSTVFQKIKLR